MHISRGAAAVLTAAALALAGCGGGGGGKSSTSSSTPASASGAATNLTLRADKTQLKFDKTALSAKAGKVTITMTNPSSLAHDIAIEGNGVSALGKVVSQGGTSTVSAPLTAGTYTFYCSVDGHRQAGMQGTLTVN